MDRLRIPAPPPEGPVPGTSTGRRLLLWSVTAGAALATAADTGLPSLEEVRALRTEWPETTAYMELRRAEAGREGQRLEIAWEPVPLSRVPDHLERAVLVAEDAAFYAHHGFDLAELRAALVEAWRERSAPRGASTLTMQLARNLYLSPETTLWRKAREAILARRLEAALDKRRILELYLSVVELGPGIFGVQAASRAYWGVPVERIGPLQAAGLAATLPSPRRSNPRTRTRAFLWRRDLIARRARADTMEQVPPGFALPAADSLVRPTERELPSVDPVPVPALGAPDSAAAGTAAVDPPPSDTLASDTAAADTARPDTLGAPADSAAAGAPPDTSEIGPEAGERVSGPEGPPPRARPRAPAGRTAPTSPPARAR